MAALDTPWLSSMSSPNKTPSNGSSKATQDPNPPTVASFSPNQSASANRQRSTILVQQKSPLLVATPPQITRALAFSHPFLLPLNKFVGLLSWSSGDPWESFLLVAGFWAVVLYGDTVIQWAGPIVVVIGLIFGMYTRRYSPLSSTGWTGEKLKGNKKQEPEGTMRHQKSLDEIVDTLNTFTSRCNVLLDPLLQLTDFLSTQRTATSATTRPALTSLFLRILVVTPVWVLLALPPVQIVTTRRVFLTIGTLMLSWHSRPARVSRTILWRSLTLRNAISALTGLVFTTAPLLPPRKGVPPPLPPHNNDQHDIANSLASSSKTLSAGLRFTFVVYENQRRWLGLGWTSSLFVYERAAWTDEHLNPSPSKDDFQLPAVNNEKSEWRWVSEWCVNGAGRRSSGASGKPVNDSWIYYDNKWNDGRRGQDGWGRYTRRRKWYRDAELVEVEVTSDMAVTPAKAPATEVTTTTLNRTSKTEPSVADKSSDTSQSIKDSDESSNSQLKRRGFFRRGSKSSAQSSSKSKNIIGSEDDEDHRISSIRPEPDGDWSYGDDIKMGLG